MLNVYGIQLSAWYPSATLPQALGTIWSYANQFSEISDNYKLRKLFWENEDVETIVDETIDPDVLFCSCYVWNWEKTYKAIQQIKEDYPNCLVVVGGPEPRYDLAWINEHPEVDILVPYYGETVFKNVLLENLSNKDFSSLAGVITQDVYNKNHIYPEFSEIPSPYLNGLFDNLLANKRKDTKSVRCVFESNRGCPYGCTFCDIGSMAYQKVKQFDLDKCYKELDWITKNDISVIDVADSNFGIFPRDEEIVDSLIELKNKHNWNGRFLPTWSKSRGDRVLKLAKKVIHNRLDSIFGLSLQSLNQPTLDAVKRVNAFDLNQLSDIIEDMNADNVHVYTELIFPMPGDTLQNFREGIYRVLDMKTSFNKFQINQLSKLSNAEFSKPEYNELHKIEWATINGFTRHYYGSGVTDTISIGNSTISKDETFEGLFFSKGFVIPLYFYGVIKHLADSLHSQNIKTRSELVVEIEEKLKSVEWFIEFKNNQKQHYMEAIQQKRQFGQNLLSNKDNFITEYAVAREAYLKNNIFENLKEWYPEYYDLIEYDRLSVWNGTSESIVYNGMVFKDDRDMSYDDYCTEVYIKGRFDDRWRKKVIEKC